MSLADHRQFLIWPPRLHCVGVDWSSIALEETPTNPAGALGLVEGFLPAWMERLLISVLLRNANEGWWFWSV